MVDLAEGDCSLFIDHEDGPLGNSWKRIAGAQDPIALSNVSMRKEVATERKMEFPGFLFLKSNMIIDGINANAHDLSITLGKFRHPGVTCRELCSSHRGPIGNMKRKHDMLLASIIAESYLVPFGAGYGAQFETRGHISDFSFHNRL